MVILSYYYNFFIFDVIRIFVKFDLFLLVIEGGWDRVVYFRYFFVVIIL